MLSADDLKSLAVGDMVETGTLLSGMSKESFRLLVASREEADTGLRIEFDARYYGINAGRYAAVVRENSVTWLDCKEADDAKK